MSRAMMTGEEFLIKSLKLYLTSDHFDTRCSVKNYAQTFVDEVLAASTLEEIWGAFMWLDIPDLTANSTSQIILEALNFVASDS